MQIDTLCPQLLKPEDRCFAHRRIVRYFIGMTLAMLLMGCASNKAGFISDAVFNPPTVTVVEDGNDTPLEIYSFDTAPNPQNAIFFVSGSGCASLRYFLRGYFTGLEGRYRIFALQKTGVSAFETGGSCSSAFNENYTADELLRRNAKALRWIKVGFPGKVVAVIGTSEGGGIAAALAADQPTIKRLVVIGSGGMTLRESLQRLAERQGKVAELNAALTAVAADPTSSSAQVLGLPHRYLTSFLDIDPLPIYARVKQPVLLVAGEKDESVPIESIQRLADALKARRGKAETIVEIVPGANHALRRDGVDLKPELMARLSRWLSGGEW